jgi:hypothetical protein
MPQKQENMFNHHHCRWVRRVIAWTWKGYQLSITWVPDI